LAQSQGRKKPRSDFQGQVNFALGQVKMEVWWSGQQVKLASVVLLVIISNQKQFQNLGLQDEQNNKFKALINLKSKHTLVAFVPCYSLSQIIDSI